MDRELNSTGTENVHVAVSKRDLEEKLTGDYRGVILATVHLFDGMPKQVTKQRTNVIVMADEAHRTQERELGTYMRSAVEGGFAFRIHRHTDREWRPQYPQGLGLCEG